MSDNDYTHMTIKVPKRMEQQIDAIVASAADENLQVMGHAHPVRVKRSHVLRLALEHGLARVLPVIRKLSRDIEKGAAQRAG